MWLFDRLASLVAGLSFGAGKAEGLGHILVPLDTAQLNASYRGDWIARKVIDVPAFDMVRAGRSWQAEDDQIEKLEAEEQRLGLTAKKLQALKWSRLYGGSAMILGVAGTTDYMTPLETDRIRAGGLEFVHVVTRHELSVSEIDRDPASPGFGEPAWYEISGGSGRPLRLHSSRVIPFTGADIPPYGAGIYDVVWGDSVLQAVHDAIIHAGLTSQGIANMVMEAKLDVYKIPNLTSQVSNSDYAQRIIARFRLANTTKSSQNALIVDKEEEWDQKQISFTGLSDIATLYLQIAAGASDIPATRLLGQAPSGLNSTGDSDIRNYYDRIAAEQTMVLAPRLARLDEVLIRSALGTRPPEIHARFNPLWQLSETERSENRKRDAETTKIYLESALLPEDALAEAVQNQLVEDAAYPGLEAALADSTAKRGISNGRLDAIIKARQAGSIRKEDEFAQLQAGGLIPAGVTFEKFSADIDVEGSVDDPEDPDAEIEIDPETGEPIDRAPPAAVQDAKPKTLYVSRRVVNVADITAWARSQGIADIEDDLHVTIAYSRSAVDWIKAGNATEWGEADGKLTIPAGGPRVVEPLGNMAAVLMFASSTLSWRNVAIREIGASWDWPDYQPHISLTKMAVNVSKIEPYRGVIVLGPEVFEEIKETR